MQQDLVKELQGIGLSDKEAKVYLAGLELGPATAQQLAAKATVNRPSAYVAIESLIKRGLMSSFQKGKKRYFNASTGKQLLYGIEQEKIALTIKEKRAKGVVNGLRTFSKTLSQTVGPIVSIYEGYEGLRAVQEEILDTAAGIEILELTSLEYVREHLPQLEKMGTDIRQAIISKHKIKALYSATKETLEEPMRHPHVEERHLNARDYPVACDFIIFDETVLIPTYGNEIRIVHIQDPNIAATSRILFYSLWQQANKYE
jgi:HTH-type transcriptional regulator, sugar sensing transcriptional regulator